MNNQQKNIDQLQAIREWKDFLTRERRQEMASHLEALKLKPNPLEVLTKERKDQINAHNSMLYQQFKQIDEDAELRLMYSEPFNLLRNDSSN